MLTPHHPSHWIAVALVGALAVLAFDAMGQSQTTTAAAAFQGMPAMAGAQAGLGALAGPPQGGLGVQGSDGAGLNLRPPQIVAQASARPSATPCLAPRIDAAEDCAPGPVNDRVERRLNRLGLDADQLARSRAF